MNSGNDSSPGARKRIASVEVATAAHVDAMSEAHGDWCLIDPDFDETTRTLADFRMISRRSHDEAAGW